MISFIFYLLFYSYVLGFYPWAFASAQSKSLTYDNGGFAEFGNQFVEHPIGHSLRKIPHALLERWEYRRFGGIMLALPLRLVREGDDKLSGSSFDYASLLLPARAATVMRRGVIPGSFTAGYNLSPHTQRCLAGSKY